MIDAPYTGLNPFSLEDAPFFFGREQERDLIVANLMASRLTVLYGPSGVGKSSVLDAGALTALRGTYRRLAPDGRPQLVAAVVRGWQVDPAAELMRTLEAQVGIAAESAVIDRLGAWSNGRSGRLLVILDQFEEYLLYHERADDELGELLPVILSRPTLAVNILISIREDAVARLDVFKGRVPILFQNYLRLDRLAREAAHEAITRPLDRFNELGLSGDQPVTIEAELVAAVLDDVRAGQLTIGEAGRGRVADRSGTGERVETPYLQLVMKRMWDAERARQSSVLRLETYRRLGGAQRIVEGHLDDTVRALSWREQAAAAAIFEHLVTPTKSKIAHTATDLASYAEIDTPRIAVLLEKLSGPNRILATVAPTADQSPETRYQIFHDVLASAVLAWTTTFRARRHQRRRMLQVAAVLIVLAALGLMALLLQRNLRQGRLIAALQENQKDVDTVKTLQGDLSRLASTNQSIATQLVRIEQSARDIKPAELSAQLKDIRQNVDAVAAQNRTLANQATSVSTRLENNQRQIAQIQGIGDAIPQKPIEQPPATVPTSPPPPPPVDPSPPPTASAGSAPTPESDTAAARAAAEAGVKAALQRYEDAYSSLDVNAVKAVFPSLGRFDELQRTFRDLSSYTMRIQITGPVEFTGSELASARVDCLVSPTYVPKRSSGIPTTLTSQRKVFFLQRTPASDWIIARTQP